MRSSSPPCQPVTLCCHQYGVSSSPQPAAGPSHVHHDDAGSPLCCVAHCAAQCVGEGDLSDSCPASYTAAKSASPSPRPLAFLYCSLAAAATGSGWFRESLQHSTNTHSKTAAQPGCWVNKLPSITMCDVGAAMVPKECQLVSTLQQPDDANATALLG